MERGTRKDKGLNLTTGIGGKNIAPFMLTPLGLILASCGGGGSKSGNPVSQDPPGSTPSSVSYSGNVVKGPLDNALVFLDYNSDGIKDSDEPSVRTGSDGSYTLTTSNSSFTIVAISDDTTIDTSSGTVMSGVTLKAPAGATVVTPTTTLMKEGDLTAEQVATVLGLPSGVDPTTFNPYASGVDATKALAVEKVSQQLMSVVNSFAASAEGAGASQANAFTASLKSVVEVVKSKATASGTLDLTNSSDLDLIKTQASTEMASVSGISKTAFDALAADTTTAIKNVNAKIGSVTDLTSDAAKNTFSTVSALQDQVKTAAIAEKGSSGSGSASITFKTSSNVDTAALNKAPTDIALSSTSISEAASSLVIGTLSTTDSDQTSGTAFTYSLAELDDYSSFSINQATGELSFKSQPDYETKTSYKVTIISKDEGGKSFSETFSLTVTNVRDSIDEALIKATVNYVNQDIYTDLKTLYDTYVEDGRSTVSKVDAELKNASFYLNKWGSTQFNSNNSSIELTSNGFTITDSSNYKLQVLFNDFSPSSLSQIQQLANIDASDPTTWIVDGGFSSIKLSGPNGDVIDVEINSSSTTFNIGSNFYDTGKWNSIKLHGKILDNSVTNILTLFDNLNKVEISSRELSTDSTSFDTLRDFVKGKFDLTGISIFNDGRTDAILYEGYSGDVYTQTIEDYSLTYTVESLASELNIPGKDIVNYRHYTTQERSDFIDSIYSRAGKDGEVKLTHKEYGDIITVTTDDLGFDLETLKGTKQPTPASWELTYGKTSTGEHYVHDKDFLGVTKVNFGSLDASALNTQTYFESWGTDEDSLKYIFADVL